MSAREWLLVLISALVTAAIRFAPFALFPPGKKMPPAIDSLGRALPGAVIGLLVVYCLRGMSFASLSGWLPAAMSAALTALSYRWRSNSLLSIALGTACYMILIRLVV